MPNKNLSVNDTFRFMGKLVLAAVATTQLASFAVAQTPSLVSTVRIIVKPDRTAEFMEIQSKFTEAFRKGGGLYRGVWRNVNNLSEFVVVTPLENFAAYDSPGPASKGMSEVENARLIARYVECLQSRERIIRAPVQGLSISMSQPPKLVHTNSSRVRMGMASQFEALIKEIFQAYEKVGLPGYGISRVRFGGSRSDYMSWRPYEKMADLDGQQWAAKALESMGEDAAQKWLEKYLQTVESSEHQIYAYVPELSYYPEQ